MGNPHGYGDTNLDTVIEKLYNLPLYLLRKLVLYYVLANLYVLDLLAKGFGFNFSYGLSDKSVWNWFADIEVPTAHIELSKKKIKDRS